MPSVPLKSILQASFRANPDYELILFDRLPTQERELLNGLQEDPDFYGVLRPRERAALELKSACRNTALLYFTLQEPGRLPAYVKAMFGDQGNQAVAELVLDGVLEIESNGTFVSGPDAYPLIYGEAPASTARGTNVRLSVEALRYVQRLELSDSRKLSVRLYMYNRLPASPEWKRRFPNSDAVAEYLGIREGGALKPTLDRNWAEVSHPPPYEGWFSWRSRHMQQAPSKQKIVYKLYVSPGCESIPDAFRVTVAVLSKLRAPSFKVGKDVCGLLRPDKIVAYFWGFEELQEAAGRLSDELGGCSPHGVPFTAGITSDGLLSWGIDPPREQQTLPWLGGESWRLWVTNHLATALLAARAADSEVEPWRYALERLRLEGVDTDSWTPARTIWDQSVVLEGDRI
jgi:hypothetical protein